MPHRNQRDKQKLHSDIDESPVRHCTHSEQVPVLLAWCADLQRPDRACELRGYTQVADYVENFLVAAVDVATTAQNAALAAESLGWAAKTLCSRLTGML